ITGKEALGFSKRDDNTSYDKMKTMLKQEMERNFRPEFLNRVDDVIVFRSLTKDNLKQIIDIELSKITKRMKEKDLILVMTDESKDLLIEKGSNVEYGARPLRRTIEHMLEDPLAEDLLHGEFPGRRAIMVCVDASKEEDKTLRFEHYRVLERWSFDAPAKELLKTRNLKGEDLSVFKPLPSEMEATVREELPKVVLKT